MDVIGMVIEQGTHKEETKQGKLNWASNRNLQFVIGAEHFQPTVPYCGMLKVTDLPVEKLTLRAEICYELLVKRSWNMKYSFCKKYTFDEDYTLPFCIPAVKNNVHSIHLSVSTFV